jgi:DNA-directed RNA polymerase subunit RPC12/RpoP
VTDIDITDRVSFVDDYLHRVIHIYECLCGKRFDKWDLLVREERSDAIACPSCGRLLYCTYEVKVFERKDDD